MDLSIIVCTYNRAESLRHTIDALLKLEIPASISHEIIVVDNNSTDETRAVMMSYVKNHPHIRYSLEARQGLSHARNHGITASTGDTILFTDDDVLPEPDWAKQILSSLEKHQASACGGYIAPIFETPPPSWLTKRFYGFLAVRDERTDDYEIRNPSAAPFGANMGFRRDVFIELGGFDTARGRKGKNLASGEDGEMFERTLKAGMKVIFVGQARVHHKVESYRLRKRYFRRWRMQASRNIALTRGIPGERQILNIPYYLIAQFLRSLASAAHSRLTKPADEAFSKEIIVWHFVGTMQGLLEARRANKQPPPDSRA